MRAAVSICTAAPQPPQRRSCRGCSPGGLRWSRPCCRLAPSPGHAEDGRLAVPAAGTDRWPGPGAVWGHVSAGGSAVPSPGAAVGAARGAEAFVRRWWRWGPGQSRALPGLGVSLVPGHLGLCVCSAACEPYLPSLRVLGAWSVQHHDQWTKSQPLPPSQAHHHQLCVWVWNARRGAAFRCAFFRPSCCFSLHGYSFSGRINLVTSIPAVVFYPLMEHKQGVLRSLLTEGLLGKIHWGREEKAENSCLFRAS